MKFHSGIFKIFRIYLLWLCIFTVFRIFFLLSNLSSSSGIQQHIFGLIGTGLQFDSCVGCYLLMIPSVLFFAMSFFKKEPYSLQLATFAYMALTGGVALLLCAADIPFYHQFHSRINIAALSWMDSPGYMVKLIFSYGYNYIFLSLFASALVFYLILLKKNLFIKKKSTETIATGSKHYLQPLPYLLIFGLLVIGARGRLQQKATINWGVAFFSSNQFANLSALNPVFAFMASIEDKNAQVHNGFHFMPGPEAIKQLKDNLTPAGYLNDSTLAHRISFQKPARKANVILIIMESMSANKMGCFPNGKQLTPFLDSLALKSHFFTHCYSDGIHTFNGLYSCLTGNPASPLQHPLRVQTEAADSFCLPWLLKQNGYATSFFTTHDEQFDFMNGFLKKNGFEQVIGQNCYPSAEVLGVTGVPDHVMFNLSMPYLNKSTQPFFATYLTGSDHQPFAFPSNTSFTSTENNAHYRIVQYADWSLRQFFQLCKKQSWYTNTLFVLVADHGAIVDGDEDNVMALHHIPLIFYSPDSSLLDRIVKDKALAGQIDIEPTIMGYLSLPYTNTCYGTDLNYTYRKKIAFTMDADRIVIDSAYYYISREVDAGLYKINPGKKYCSQTDDSIKAKGLRDYSNAVYQLLSKK